MIRSAAVLVLLCGCSHDVGALRARGERDAGPDSGGPFEVAPSVVSEDPMVPGSFTCALDGLTARGGEAAAIGSGPDTGSVSIARTAVSGCIRAAFATPAYIDSLVVSARRSASACGDDCTTACGTASSLHVFTGDASGVALAGTLTPSAELADVTLPVDATIGFVVLCRGSEPETQDDLEIDYVAALR